ncbi:GNAT family N-acetyltransferase [Edaphobacter bradus]|uniref:GNAT family N-acetyltransferase n=1 Tax=Edaphobacter bradus TaxID=2259016 RepID=UPI0021E0B2B2|nr:GNAT family N-acetyltransferase [Edaphobacter bradus]
MATPELETARLVLRPLRLSDADQVQPLFAHWEVVKYLNVRVPWPFPEGGVFAYYGELALPAVERGEEWHWTIRLKDEPERIIGAISLHLNREINRGFWIAPEWRGQGLMTEAVAEVTRFWFEDLRQPVLRTKKAVANAASRAISAREGMRCVQETEDDYVSGRLPTELWEMDAAMWRERRRHA